MHDHEQPNAVNDVACERCGKSVSADFSSAYRRLQLNLGRADPGNLCGSCAGADTGERIAKVFADEITPMVERNRNKGKLN